MSKMSLDACDIDLPPRPPAVPSWLGSLCSQIDSYKDFTLPQVFTPRNVNHGTYTGKIPSTRTEKDSKVDSSSQMIQDERAKRLGNSNLSGQNYSTKIQLPQIQNHSSVFHRNQDHQFHNSYDLNSCALSQQETEYVPASQPWPSLQPVPERLNRVSHSGRNEDQPFPGLLQPVPERPSRVSYSSKSEEQPFPGPSQPWPSSEVWTQPASQACRITSSRLTRSCLPVSASPQNQRTNPSTDSPPDLFGDSPTYSPLTLLPPASQKSDVLQHSPGWERWTDNLGWRKPKEMTNTRNYTGRKRPETDARTPASSYTPQINSMSTPAADTDARTQASSCISQINNVSKPVAAECTPLSGESSTAIRIYSLVESGNDAAGTAKRDQRGMSVTPGMGRHCNPYTPAVINFQGAGSNGLKLHSVEEIPKPFCDIFPFPFFNAVQSMAFDKLLYTDSSVVMSAPTGSGKTALFELAILRLLLCAQLPLKDIRVIYIGPMKSLCGERVEDWRHKLAPVGLDCVELTGDSDLNDFSSVYHAQVICTTPEKWDSVTRRWKDNRQLFQSICLVCIDEVHIVGDAQRGATVEAVITRMKMVHTLSAGPSARPVRFVAVSATLPNTEDIGEWLSSHSSQAAIFKLGEEYRPVRLQRVVLGYPFSEGSSEFRFDLNLTYKLHSVIDSYSHGKPTLVFCSSRKSCQQTAETLVKRRWGQSSFVFPQFRQEISTAAGRIQEKKLSELLMNGVGIHHAGLEVQDRKLMEELFRSGKLAVLIATSTLSVGVNLPAHLVVVKATHLYVMGVAREYSDQQVLQMIGRAGRPQFDTSATVVIMTRVQLKAKYEALVNGTQVIESMLHRNLTEHVNVEVVLHTITDMADAASWLSHTLLHVRATKHPRHYGLPSGLSTQQVEQKLQDLCMTAINKLNSLHLVSVDPDTTMTAPTERGRLMARYCLEFQTVRHLLDIPPKSSVEILIGVVSNCSEFQDILLRTSEKKTLNMLNKNKTQETIRYPMKGKIKTKQMKVNCLVQAGLGCLPVQDYSLSQDLLKIFRVGQRITKCLMELQWLGEDYTTLLHALQLCKAFKARLWPDSTHVARQLEGIGPTISQALLQAGLASFQLLEAAEPQRLEMVVNRHPPFGSRVREAVTHLPRYELIIQQEKSHQAASAQLVISVCMLNAEEVRTLATCGVDHQLVFIMGDEDNTIVFKWKLSDRMLLSQMWRRKVSVKRALSGAVLHVGLISLDWAGLDIHTEYQPFYTSVLHPNRYLREAQSSAQPDSSTAVAAQPTKRGKPTPGPPKEAPQKNGKTNSGGVTARGPKKADSKIQQQLDVMHFKLQQFHRTVPTPVPKLTHDTQGTEGARQSVRGQDFFEQQSRLLAKPWEEPHSPEVNLQTEPWGDLVNDFWDESDFDQPPSKMPKRMDSVTDKTSASDLGRQVFNSSEDKKILSAGTAEVSGFRAEVNGNKPSVFPPSHMSRIQDTGSRQTQAVKSVDGCAGIVSRSASAAENRSWQNTRSFVGTNHSPWMKSNPAVGFKIPKVNTDPAVNMSKMNTDPVVGMNVSSREVSNLHVVNCRSNTDATSSFSTNSSVNTLQAGKAGYSTTAIPDPDLSCFSTPNKNMAHMYNAAPSRFAPSATPPSDLHRSSAAMTHSDLHKSSTMMNSDLHKSSAMMNSDLHKSSTMMNSDLHKSSTMMNSDLHKSSTMINSDLHKSSTMMNSSLHKSSTMMNSDLHKSSTMMNPSLHKTSTPVNSDLHRSSVPPQPPTLQTTPRISPADRRPGGTGSEMFGSMNSVAPRELSSFSREKLPPPAAAAAAAAGRELQHSGKGAAEGEEKRHPAPGRETAARPRKSGCGWEHLQLYQCSRETLVGNPDTQESSEGEDSWFQSVVPEPQPREIKETNAVLPARASSCQAKDACGVLPGRASCIQQRPVEVTSPMVTGMVPPHMAPLHSNRSVPQSISTANLLQGIF